LFLEGATEVSLDWSQSVAYSVRVNLSAAPEFTVGVIDGDNVIVTQSWFNQMGLVLLAVVLEIGIIYLTAVFPEMESATVWVDTVRASASYLPFVPLGLLGVAALRIYNERLVITPLYLIHVSGRLSWRERSMRLEYSDIQEIETDCSIMQRLFGVGDVSVIPMGGNSNNTITLRGVRHPRGVKDLIRQARAS
jgi:hypothetical protein